MGSVSNIIASFAQLYVAPKETELPRALFGWPSGWMNLGYTFGGVEITYETDVVYHKVDQESGPVLCRVMGTRAKVRSSVAEVTISNIKRFVPCKDLIGSEVTGVSVGGGLFQDYMLGVEGVGPDGIFRAYLFHDAGSIGVGIGSGKNALNLAKVEWDAIGDIDILEGSAYIPTTPGVDLMKVYRWTASGLTTIFDIPMKIISGSDPMVMINGITQDPGVGYTVQAFSTYTRIVFTELPTAGDVIQAFYQVRT